MSILINAHKVSKSFATRPLFRDLSFSVESGDRIGLIGPNGAGKSTLLRVLAGQVDADSGTLSRQKGLRVGFLEQVPTFEANHTVFEALMQAALDPHDWDEMSLAHEIIAKLNLAEDTLVNSLSGGWRKRVALGRELMKRPDLLMLDEPTNHLDVDGIIWLEDFLESASFATIVITHDRVFLQNVSTRILELDRRNVNGLLDVRGSYADYLFTKEDLMSAQESQETRLRNTLRRETQWLRQGAKARTTKQSARIERAGELKVQVEELEERNKHRQVRIDFQNTGSAPKKLIQAVQISKSIAGKKIVPQIEELIITPKTRLGLLGRNGCGKSTLLNLLLKKQSPDTGQVTHADALKVAYFEQNRDSLDPNSTVLKSVCPMGEYVDFGAGKVHVSGFLKRFLFGPEMHDQPVSKLSGGEQARLLIAKLMLQPANVLVLDEPTNDLDMATLNVLEEVLGDFEGAVLLVSHDRYFLDQVSREILAFHEDNDGSPQITKFLGVTQWQKWFDQKRQSALQTKIAPTGAEKAKVPSAQKKLSFNEKFELDNIEDKIKACEDQIRTLSAKCSEPEVMSNAQMLRQTSVELSQAQLELDRLYARWAELERN
jgi:ATP-binding cassette subfamily F protein uup